MLLDRVFPNFCFGCGVPNQIVCPACERKLLVPVYEQFCHICHYPSRTGLVHQDCEQFTFLDGVLVGFVYDSIAKQLVQAVKYEFRSSLIRYVAGAMNRQLVSLHKLDVEAVTYVPTSRRRRWYRGFNQSKLLAQNLAAKLNLPCLPVLDKQLHTDSQVGQKREERLGNLVQAFGSISSTQTPKSVLIVDDVMTTGATLESCAKVLKHSGVEQVFGAVFARGIVTPQAD